MLNINHGQSRGTAPAILHKWKSAMQENLDAYISRYEISSKSREMPYTSNS
jgi:hypothetical protein